MSNFVTSAAMRRKIEGWEGKRNVAYQDGRGNWTIGYGHTGADVHEGLVWTDQQCDEAMTTDLQRFETDVNSSCGTASQNQFDALVSFAYNCGFGNLVSSTLLREHRAGYFPQAAAEFPKWDNPKDEPGILRRRLGEQAVYANDDYTQG